MKKIFYLVLLLTLLTVSCALAADSGSCGENAFWTYDSNVLTISGQGQMSNYDDSYSTPWYQYKNDITSVIINDGVTSIGSWSFSSFKKLSRIQFPESLTCINMCAFYHCSSLSDVQLPDSLSIIDQNAFRDCSSLTSIVIPQNVETIGFAAFAQCINLSNVIFQNALETIEASAFSGCSSLTTINLPESITSLGRNAFSSCTSLSNITLPDKITTIGQNAFYGCSSLTSIHLPKSLSSLGSWAFYACRSLSDITLPTNLSLIDEYTFYDCVSLSSISIQESAKSICDHAFSGCINLESIGIPRSLTKIGLSVFDNCKKLRTVYYAGNETAWSNVLGNGSLSNATIVYNCFGPDPGSAYNEICGENIIWSFDSGLLTISGTGQIFDGQPWYKYQRYITSVIIKTGVTSIGSYAFDECSNLSSVNLPETLISINKYAFNNCKSLLTIQLPEAVSFIDDEAFVNCNDELIIQSACCTDSSYQWAKAHSFLVSAESHSNIIIDPEIPSTCTDSGMSEGSHCGFCNTVLCVQVIIPASHILTMHDEVSATYYEDGIAAYWSCDKCGKLFGDSNGEHEITEPVIISATGVLARGTFGDGFSWLLETNKHLTISGIGDMPDFNDHYQNTGTAPWKDYRYDISSVTVANSITHIGSYSFDDCYYLTAVEIPDNVTSIGPGAFKGCGLKNITLPGGLSTIEEHTFFSCNDLESIVIPNGVTSIGSSAFGYCNKLASVIIPNTVTNIGSQSFSRCSILSEIVIPESVSNIGFGAFSDCTSLSSIVIPESVTTIESSTFSGCTNLAHIAIPQSVVKINSNAFSNCNNISSITVSSCSSYAYSWAKKQGYGSIIQSLSHVDVVIDEGTPATCEDAGLTEGSHCSYCGTVLIEQEVISALGHEVVIDMPKLDPTCTKTGYTELSHCAVCDIITSKRCLLPALGHTPVVDDAVEATCTESGLTEGAHCSICGESLMEQEIIPAKGHNIIIDPRVAPTASSTGLTEGSHCSVCGQIIKAQIIIDKTSGFKELSPCIKFKFPSGYYLEASTSQGETYCHQTILANTITIRKPIYNNSYNTTDKIKEYYRSKGITVIGTQKIKVVDNDGVFIRNPVSGDYLFSSTVEIVYGYDSNNSFYLGYIGFYSDGAFRQIMISNLVSEGSHYLLDYVDSIVCQHKNLISEAGSEPTCDTPGVSEGLYCDYCKEDLLTATNIPRTGHRLKKTDSLSPTCTDSGYNEFWECTKCKKMFNDVNAENEINSPVVINALGHNMIEHDSIIPTCTSDGFMRYWSCTTCGNLFEDREGTAKIYEPSRLLALGHTIIEVTEKEASCTETGNIKYWMCTTCNTLFSNQYGTVKTTQE